MLSALFIVISFFSDPEDDRINQIKLNTEKYDPFVARLMTKRGEWIPPTEELLGLIRKHRFEILEASKKFDIPPVAIASAILAENTLNVGISDSVQDYLTKNGILSTGGIAGRQFSVGLGQMKSSVAMEGEEILAQYEQRPMKTQAEVTQELLKPERAFLYVGAVMRKYANDYEKVGFKISDRGDLLVTLYNLGEVEKRSQEAKQTQRFPRINYFGVFYEKWKATIEETLQEADTPAEKISKMRPWLRLTQPVSLWNRVPYCSLDEEKGPEREYRKIFTRTQGIVIAEEKKASQLKVHDIVSVCGYELWAFVRDDNDIAGWLPLNVLEAKSEKLNQNPAFQFSAPQSDIAAKVKEWEKSIEGFSLAEGPARTLQVGLIFRGEGVKSYKYLPKDWSQGDEGRASSSGEILSEAEKKELMKLYEVTKARLIAEADEKKLRKDGETDPEFWERLISCDSTDPELWIMSQVMSHKLTKNNIDYDSPYIEVTRIISRTQASRFTSLLQSISLKKTPEFQVARSLCHQIEEINDTIDSYKKILKPKEEIERLILINEEKIAEELSQLKMEFDDARWEKFPTIKTQGLALLSEIEKSKNTIARYNGESLPNELMSKFSELFHLMGILLPQEKRDDSVTHCTIYPRNTNAEEGWNLPIEILNKLVKTDQDREEILQGSLDRARREWKETSKDWRKDYFPTMTDDDEEGDHGVVRASYEPFKTVQMIRSLLKDPAVKRIEVPDLWLLQAVEQSLVRGEIDPHEAGKLIYRSSSSEDRFFVVMK